MRAWREMSGESRTVVKLVALVATMASLGFASVPFYDWFCRTTGFGGTPLRAESNESLVRDETGVWCKDEAIAVHVGLHLRDI